MLTRVAASLTSVELAAAGVDRAGLTIYNDSATGTLKVNRNADASITAFIVAIAPNGYWVSPFGVNAADGQWTGIWDVASGAANVASF